MENRVLGTDLVVSAIGLGCMGMTHASGAPADVKEMTELLAEAVDMGLFRPALSAVGTDMPAFCHPFFRPGCGRGLSGRLPFPRAVSGGKTSFFYPLDIPGHRRT